MLVHVVAQTTSPTGGGFDIFSLLLPVALGLLIFTMFRKQRKMKQQVAEQRTQMVPGTEVMTNFGMFGTLVSLDEDNNQAVLEVSPGTNIVVHSQVLTKVVTHDAPAVDQDTPLVPDDASSLTTGSSSVSASEPDRPSDTPASPAAETPEETLKRLNSEDSDRLNGENTQDKRDRDN